jgi:hypothetical protein
MNTFLPINFSMKGIGMRRLMLLAVLLFTIFSCKDDKEKIVVTAFDPNLPVEVTSFMPDSGGIRTKFVVKGSNFGTDKSKVNVYFTDADKDRLATIIGLDNETIYCLVPKENAGFNSVKVTIESKTGTISKKFLYIVAQSVSTVVGLNGAAVASINGSLSDARMQRTFGIAALGNDELISFESMSSAVRYISVNDNKVTTLQTGFDGTHPALNAAGTKLYSIGRTLPHKVYFYEKSSLWQPQILAAQIPGSTGIIYAACLDETEEWLYFRDKDGKFGRLEIANPTNVQILNANCGNIGATEYSFMIYSKFDNCFYFSVQSLNGIYKVSKDGKTVEEYAGFHGFGKADGPKNTGEQFYGPSGLCLDSEGNIYVADANSYLIRKITRGPAGYVSTIAGTYLINSGVNGLPLVSSLNYPYCLTADKNDVIFIGESWGQTIRKLAIE